MTPKTLDKYIAALKKKAAAGGWTMDYYQAELDKIKNEMAEQYLDDKITAAEYAKVSKQLSNAEKNPGLLGKQQPVMQTADPGQQAADDAVLKLEKEMKKVYAAAAKEIKAQLKEFTDQFNDELTEKQEKVYAGEMTHAQLQAWINSQHQMKKILEQKIDQCTGVMLNANQKAMGMINGETVNVFAENANWQSYELSQNTKMNLMFSVYDEYTANKLLKDKPELLPRKTVNGKKDKAWNQKVIANSVLQAVIQGESIPKLAKRIAAQTGETNMNAMTRYARTAMTSAQNAGRMEMLHRAQGMGIKCKKVWLATLDSRTRDAHAKLDGQTVDIDDDFQTDFGPLKFPGDTGSKGSVPANLYNCRCTLIYEYDGFPNDPTLDQRIMYDEWDEKVPVTKKDKNGKEYEAHVTVHHRESKLIQDMTYDEWKAAKEHDKLNALNAAKLELAEMQKQVVNAKIKEDKIYDGLWKDPVTLADYADKKVGIPAKLDYYDTEIDKYKQAQAEGKSWATDEKIKELEKKRKLLKEYQKNGELIEKRDAALKAVQDIYDNVGHLKTAVVPGVPQKATKTSKKAASASGGTSTGTEGQSGAGLNLDAKKQPFEPDAYTQDRKDKALWSTDKDYVDGFMREHTGEIWRGASDAEKDAIFEYTQSYSKYNEPLRGYEYGTSRYLGVGKTDLDAGYKHNGRALNAMTDLIDKCSYDHDMWLQRGCRWGGMDKFFQVDMNLLQYGSEKELQQALLGKTVTEYGFMSMGSAKGQGFSGNILLNVYAPAGTKMMYVEPFSYYGHNRNGNMNKLSGRKWNGKSKQPTYSHEDETIMQQGTQFRVTKVEKKGSQLYVDIEVINQDNQQRWKQ